MCVFFSSGEGGIQINVSKEPQHTHIQLVVLCFLFFFSSSSWVEEEASGQQRTPNSSKPVGPWGGNQIRREKENKKGGNIPLHPQCCCSRLSRYSCTHLVQPIHDFQLKCMMGFSSNTSIPLTRAHLIIFKIFFFSFFQNLKLKTFLISLEIRDLFEFCCC